MAERDLRLVLVTPERTLLDEPVQSLRFPLYDGQIGVLPGRAPLVGRLGYGELLIGGANGQATSYFVDGGFVQIKGPVVTLLTGRAMLATDIDQTEAEAELARSQAIVARSDLDFELKESAVDRARRMATLARRSR
jgi:F-type H+-transporting ATPase subunit epsilon